MQQQPDVNGSGTGKSIGRIAAAAQIGKSGGDPAFGAQLLQAQAAVTQRAHGSGGHHAAAGRGQHQLFCLLLQALFCRRPGGRRMLIDTQVQQAVGTGKAAVEYRRTQHRPGFRQRQSDVAGTVFKADSTLIILFKQGHRRTLFGSWGRTRYDRCSFHLQDARMLTLLSPAKTLDFDTPPTTAKATQADFLQHSAELVDVLKQYSPDDISALMKLSPALSELNVQRYHDWRLPFNADNAKAAILAFKGDVYTGLQADTLDETQLDFAQNHVRILSGLYGLLRPLDLIQPYRLEMGTKLHNGRGKDLYSFWGSIITDALNRELEQQNADVVVNLASNEYFKSVQPKKLNGRLITPVFKDEKNGQYKIISFYAKKARGLMTAYIIRRQLQTAEALQDFDVAGYRFSAEDSRGDTWVFKRAEKDIPNA